MIWRYVLLVWRFALRGRCPRCGARPWYRDRSSRQFGMRCDCGFYDERGEGIKRWLKHGD